MSQTPSMPLRLRRLKVFLDFWHSPWGAAKTATWEWFAGERTTYHIDSAYLICSDILAGYHKPYDWTAFDKELKALDDVLGVCKS